MTPPIQFFTVEEATVLGNATTYEELSAVALEQLKRMVHLTQKPTGIVCGPISNGGLGSKELNIAHFEKVVRHFVKVHNGHFFSQIPFEEALWRVQRLLAGKEPGVVHPKGDGNPLLEKFYRPIFTSGLIGHANFIKGWQSSDGADWEHCLCGEFGVTRNYLDHVMNLHPVPLAA